MDHLQNQLDYQIVVFLSTLPPSLNFYLKKKWQEKEKRAKRKKTPITNRYSNKSAKVSFS
jgi:hypothetical protein